MNKVIGVGVGKQSYDVYTSVLINFVTETYVKKLSLLTMLIKVNHLNNHESTRLPKKRKIFQDKKQKQKQKS